MRRSRFAVVVALVGVVAACSTVGGDDAASVASATIVPTTVGTLTVPTVPLATTTSTTTEVPPTTAPPAAPAIVREVPAASGLVVYEVRLHGVDLERSGESSEMMSRVVECSVTDLIDMVGFDLTSVAAETIGDSHELSLAYRAPDPGLRAREVAEQLALGLGVDGVISDNRELSSTVEGPFGSNRRLGVVAWVHDGVLDVRLTLTVPSEGVRSVWSEEFERSAAEAAAAFGFEGPVRPFLVLSEGEFLEVANYAVDDRSPDELVLAAESLGWTAEVQPNNVIVGSGSVSETDLHLWAQGTYSGIQEAWITYPAVNRPACAPS